MSTSVDWSVSSSIELIQQRDGSNSVKLTPIGVDLYKHRRSVDVNTVSIELTLAILLFMMECGVVRFPFQSYLRTPSALRPGNEVSRARGAVYIPQEQSFDSTITLNQIYRQESHRRKAERGIN